MADTEHFAAHAAHFTALGRVLPSLAAFFAWLLVPLQAASFSLPEAALPQLEHDAARRAAEADGDANARFWHAAFSPLLDAMLRGGGYAAARREDILDFYRACIVPFFGPRPARGGPHGRLIPHWKSFMTDDFTPLEPSWTWKAGRAAPLVKFSTEAIPMQCGADAGAVLARAQDMAACLQASASAGGPGALQFDKHALDAVLAHTATSDADIARFAGPDTAPGSTALSQIFLGFDMEETATHSKAYLVPTLRSLATGMSKLDIITQAVAASGAGDGWAAVLAYLASLPSAEQPDPFLLAIDCKRLDAARFKVYLRFPTTDIALLTQHVTLGGRLPLPGAYTRALADIWSRLTADGHTFARTAQTPGGVMYFSVQRGVALPTPKFYIPVRLLGRDDLFVARTFGAWIADHGHVAAGLGYVDALQKLSPDRELDARRGFHSYIGAVPTADGGLEPSVYLNPGLFS